MWCSRTSQRRREAHSTVREFVKTNWRVIGDLSETAEVWDRLSESAKTHKVDC